MVSKTLFFTIVTGVCILSVQGAALNVRERRAAKNGETPHLAGLDPGSGDDEDQGFIPQPQPDTQQPGKTPRRNAAGQVEPPSGRQEPREPEDRDRHCSNHRSSHRQHFYTASDGDRYVYASCHLNHSHLVVGNKEGVRGVIDAKQKYFQFFGRQNHGGEVDMNFDLRGLDPENDVNVGIHYYGMSGSCLSIGDVYNPVHVTGNRTSLPAQLRRVGDLGILSADDFGNIKSQKSFKHVTLVGAQSILGRSFAVKIGTKVVGCCTWGHADDKRWASLRELDTSESASESTSEEETPEDIKEEDMWLFW